MQRQQAYPMTYPPTHTSHLPRYSSSHCTSSAFSASAQPNEDWTKISDLAERRRIQNRIAQRNYRKKIKRRLEDLEKRASTSPSPEQTFQELNLPSKSSSKRNSGARRQSVKRETFQPSSRKSPPEPLVTPYSSTSDSRQNISPGHYKREMSMSPPQHLDYPYSMPDPNSPSYPPHPSYHNLPQPFSGYPNHSPYLPTVPATLPAMSSFESGQPKSNQFFDDNNMTNQYGMGYTSFTSMELPMQQQYPDSNLNTPPLSHSRSFDRSRDGSPSIFPVTPISNPDSPKMAFR